MKKTLLFLGIVIVGFGFPNLLWLTGSTLKIKNNRDKVISSVIVHVDEKQKKLQDLIPGQSSFILLPKSGDSTIKITYYYDEIPETDCRDYIEDSMYHVEVEINRSTNKECNISLPITSELLLFKLLK